MTSGVLAAKQERNVKKLQEYKHLSNYVMSMVSLTRNINAIK